MNTYQFIASLVQSITSIAWPAALVISVWLFRERVSELLPLLRVKYKNVEATFRLEQAEKEAEALPQTPELQQITQTPEEKSKFEQLAEISPRAAIIEVRADIEEAVRTLAEQVAGRMPASSPYRKNWASRSLLALTRFLRNNEYIDPHTSSLLEDLRVVGNGAAHSTASFFTKEDAVRYRALADQVIVRLGNERPQE